MRKWLLLILAAVLLYIPFFPERTKAEFTVTPRWVVDPRKAEIAKTDDAVIPFRTANEFGYIDTEGRVALVESVLYGVAIDTTGYLNYSSIGTDLVFQLPDGSVYAPLQTRGYPVFIEGGLFIVSTNRTRIEEWSTDGTILWSREFGSLITSFDVRGDYIVFGLLDGRIQLSDRDGNLRFDRRLSDARVDIVYGCTVDSSGSRIVVVHGLDPQLLSIFDFRDGLYSETVSRALENQFRTNRLLYLTPDERIVFVEESHGVLVYSLESGNLAEIELDGTLAAYGDFETGPYYWFAAKRAGASTLTIMTARGSPIYGERMERDFVRGVAIGSHLYFGVDDRVVSIGVTLQ